MGKSIVEQIEILKKFLEDKDELEQRLKEQKEKFSQLKFAQKDNPDLAKQVSELKGTIKETQRELKHAKKQVKWFSAQIGGHSSTSFTLLAIASVITFIVGAVFGYFVLPVMPDRSSGVPVDNLIVCEFVYSGEPAGLGPTFEIAQNKTLHCYAELSRRSRKDYYIEWIHRGILKDSTPLPVSAKKGGPAWCKKEFTLEDLGEWEAHLKTRDGNTWSITNFKLVYPRIEIIQAVICESMVENRPQLPGNRFLSRDIDLYCFTETRTKEKYTEIIHNWYYGNKLMSQKKIQLDELESRKWSNRNVKASEIGDWHVDILSGDGTVLKRLEFEIQNQNTAIPYMEMCTGIIEGKPDSVIDSFVADGRELYCFTRAVSNFPNFKIRHQWIYNKKKLGKRLLTAILSVRKFLVLIKSIPNRMVFGP